MSNHQSKRDNDYVSSTSEEPIMILTRLTVPSSESLGTPTEICVDTVNAGTSVPTGSVRTLVFVYNVNAKE